MRKLTFFSLCLVAFILPFENMLTIDPDASYSYARVLGLVVAIFALGGLCEFKGLRVPSVPMLALIPFFLWCLCSLTWAADMERAVSTIIRLINLLFFLWAIWEFCRTRSEFLWLLRSYLLGHIIPFAMVLTNRSAAVGQLEDTDVLRATGGGQDQNYLSEMMVIGILICIYMISIAPKGSMYRWLYVAFIGLATVCTFLTGSRAGFGGLLLAAMWAVWFLGTRGRLMWAAMIVIVAGAVALVVAPIVVPRATLNRVVNPESYQGTELKNRLDIWEAGYASFKRRPVLGLGMGMYYIAADEDPEGRKTVAHNILISFVVELGLIGLLLYLMMLALLVRAVWQLPRNERVFWLGMLAVWMFFSLTGPAGVDKLTWFVTAMAMNCANAACAVAPRRPNITRADQALVGMPRLAPGAN